MYVALRGIVTFEFALWTSRTDLIHLSEVRLNLNEIQTLV